MKPSILLVDDEPAILFAFSEYLSMSGYVVKKACRLAEARDALYSRQFEAVILDVRLPDGNGIDWISDLRESYPDIAIVVITGLGDIPMAVEAMRRGADHFLTKPINMTDIDVFLRKSLELSTLRRRNLTSQRLAKKVKPYLGESTAMKRVLELAMVAAENDSPVLLLGETGSGKGVFAQWIHEHSSLSSTPFIEVNCSTLRGELLASELFGHARGAFTSAAQDRQGLIEIADRGTLFLDEIGDMDVAVQAQFLKVIEEKQYRRLGEVRVRRSNFRLICATNRNLQEEVRQGRFRTELYFRINVFPIAIPPLRDRLEDMPGLVRYLLRFLGSSHLEVTPEVIQLLKTYSWPGNVRELKNVLERALMLSRGDPLDHELFRFLLFDYPENSPKMEMLDLDQLEEEHIQAVIARSGGDLTRTAEVLGISRATIYRRLKKFRVHK